MLFTLPHQKPVLVDDQMLPRYWASVWSIFHGAGLATSTLKRKLSDIEALYAHTENVGGVLDDELAALDFEALGNMLEAFFVSLLNVPSPKSTSQTRWKTAFLFVRDTCERLERNPAMAHRMADIRERIAALDRLYIGLRPLKKRFNSKPRAIPASVLLEIMEVVTPGSARNPFDQVATQWRVYSLFVLLLNCVFRPS